METARPFGSNKPQNISNRIYQSSDMKRFSRRYKDKHPYCANCAKKGITALGCVMDHVIGIKVGGALKDERNLQNLCRRCDQTKRFMEKSGTWTIATILNEKGEKIPGGEVKCF